MLNPPWYLLVRSFVASILVATLASCTGDGSVGTVGTNAATRPTVAEAGTNPDGWIGAWSAAPYGPFPNGPISGVSPYDFLSNTSVLPNNEAQEQSFRMIVHPTMGGDVLRVRFSNLKGDRPVRIEPVTIAKTLVAASVQSASAKPLTFSGSSAAIIPAGQEIISDPVAFSYRAGESLSVSFHVVGNSGPITWHAVSFGLNYLTQPGAGNQTGDDLGLAFTQVNTGWFLLSGVDVYAPDYLGAVVTVGDSITDGAYIVPTTNTRWPDFLANRLQAAGIRMSVLNQGINSNTVTDAAIQPGQLFKGPSAESRFDRDVLGRSKVKTLILFEGTNDLGAGVPAPVIYTGLSRIVKRAKDAGLCVLLGTVTPRLDVALGWDRGAFEPQRKALNDLIRGNTEADYIIDFERAMSVPFDSSIPNAALFFPDLLHPNSVGFDVMAQQVPLDRLVPGADGHCRK